ncbi:MAG: N-acetylglucosamine-6-phosphate deacetylase [Rhodospirillales bacterium]|nr:N-acetylglucosamine-6-phosphate deacetylase [Rhodospirillales bacterium]
MRAISAERLFDGTAFRTGATVLIEGERIAGIADELPPGIVSEHAELLVPGFIDLQVNGGGGIMFNAEPAAATLVRIARAHAACGTTSILATFISDAAGPRAAALAAVAAAVEAGVPGLVGLHLEGPFISPSRPGIHRASAIVAMTEEDAESLAPGFPLLITLAPECVASGLIARLVAGGAVVFAGHTEAQPHHLATAAAEGLSGCTHLWNAMPPFASRAPGPVGGVMALAAEGTRLFAGLIADGHHVDAASLRATIALLGPDRAFLVSDAMATAASDLDSFELDGQPIRLVDGRLTDAAGTLAGAHLTMAAAVRCARAMRLAGDAAILRMATATPAAVMGLRDRGHLAPGMRADLVALDRAWSVASVWLAGSRL